MSTHTKIVLFLTSIAVLLSVGLLVLSKNSAPNKNTNAISSLDWIKGNNEAKVILIEYSDFQCPACGAYYPILRQLHQEFGDKIVFVYRHFPLRQSHKNAELAARSAEAAGKQGQFWPMHDMLFEKQPEWSNQVNAKEAMIKYAQLLNLDTERFQNDLEAKEVKDRVNGDYQSGIQAKVNATPTFFLNGDKLDNPRSYEEFQDLIQKAVTQNL